MSYERFSNNSLHAGRSSDSSNSALKCVVLKEEDTFMHLYKEKCMCFFYFQVCFPIRVLFALEILSEIIFE